MANITGLSEDVVRERVARGQTNFVHTTTSRTFHEIFATNVFTRFNAILGLLLVVVFVAGSPADGLFGLVLLSNSTIGVIQEWASKKKLDRLALLHAPTSRVLRDGRIVTVPTTDIVLNDVVHLTSGDQVPADGTVIDSQNLEINEANLTGESDAISKSVGDILMSGTIVTAGSGLFETTKVGQDAYVHRLAAEAKVFTRTPSEIQNSITRILVWVTWILVAVTPLQVWSHFREASLDGWQDNTVRIVSGLVGLVPEGLVLLTTLTFLSAAVSLAQHNVLVQELPAVETLARVDVVCLDKTGTLTSGAILCDGIEVLSQEVTEQDIHHALGALADDPSANNTLKAIGGLFPNVAQWTQLDAVPFDSSRKWKAASYKGHGAWFLGAPEMLWSAEDNVASRVGQLADTGMRVMMLAHARQHDLTTTLPPTLFPVALIVLKEDIRPDASATLAFFREQRVRVIVISGDNPKTVGAIAQHVGVSGPSTDARIIGDTEEDVSRALATSSIFGRVSPEQKRLMVTSLQNQGHVVAMTGDGVNDALALKRADIGIAMDNGAPATKAMAQLILLDGKFSHLPYVLSEGRRVIGNVERVAHLFLAKNAMSLLAILASALLGVTFPILPRQMTLLSTVTIGIPAFLLALGPNDSIYRPGFLRRIMKFAWPAGALAGLSVVIADAWTQDTTGTTATLTALMTFFAILASKSQPLGGWRLLLVLGMAVVAVSAFIVPSIRNFFDFSLSGEIVWKSIVLSLPLLLYSATRMRKDA